MLRGRTLSRALVLAGLLLWALPAAANQTIGGACTTGNADSPQTGDGNNVVCVGSVWQYPAYQHGSTSNSCSSTYAGQVQYTSGVLEACVATGSTYTWIPISSGMQLIGTVTANNTATTIRFSTAASNWSSSYNTLFLNCAGLLEAGANPNFVIEVGEGAGPTWETGANYTTYSGPDGSPDNTSTTSTDLIGFGMLTSNTIPLGFKLYIDNVGSSSIVKMVHGQFHRYNDGGATYDEWRINGYYNNDTNPITGIEVVGNSGNWTAGTCSLYGFN